MSSIQGKRLFSHEKRRQRDLINACKHTDSRSQGGEDRLFSAGASNRTRGSTQKLEPKKFHMNITEDFTLRVTEH